jgi:hypothetical protein
VSGAPLDRFVPAYDAAERHTIAVGAPPPAAMAALWRADLGGPGARALMALRVLPAAIADAAARARLRELAAHPEPTLRALPAMGFALLHRAPDAVVFGLTGRFWTLGGGIVPTDPATWGDGPPPGSAQAAWSFEVLPRAGGGTTLATETRVRCADEATRRAFGRYWRVVRHGSALMRVLMLRRARAEAERGVG